MRYVAQQNEEVLFCGCKHTASQPFCDGAHNNLLDVYEEDDPLSEDNLKIPVIARNQAGRAHLNGHCYVADIEQTPSQQQGNLSWKCMIDHAAGAKHQSQYYFVVAQGKSAIISFAHSDVVILATAGEGTISISKKDFQISPEMGIYIRPSECFCINNEQTTPIKLYISVCPQAEGPAFLQNMPNNFDNSVTHRTISIDTKNRQMMADRFFQMLVDKKMGSTEVTQFIGEVPQSKAALHRHLYEETIVVLKGQGFMWTDSMKAAVKAGDVIFLPSKQIHSLECTNPDGMMLAGVIYPGDNPAINY